MNETLTFTPKYDAPVEESDALTFPECEPSIGAVGDLGQRALMGAVSTAERGGFTLPEETEAELRTVFENAPQNLPLSAHGLGCDTSDEGGKRHHAYLLPGYEPVAEL